MKKVLKKRVLAGVLSASMLVGLAVGGSETRQAEKNKAAEPQEQDTEAVITEQDEDLSDLLDVSLNLDGALDGEKEETVYVMADAYGEKKSVVVSEWLKNTAGAAEIKDKSELSDIENVKGDETFTRDGQNLTWQADGKPIYYQGTSEKELPISVKVSYTLDGKTVKAEELAGAKGTVKIRFDYENKAKEGDAYAPFLCVSGMLLDGENFSEVEVSSGKVIADGTRFIVVGLAMPGLQDSLNLSEDSQVSIPSYVEVTAQATNFSMDMALTFATPFVLSEDAIELKENEYFVGDVIGLKTITDDGRILGTLEDVLETGANDVYVISSAEDPEKEILLPVIRDVILEINPEEGYMKVHMLPGLE